jgi:hypothetical protein
MQLIGERTVPRAAGGVAPSAAVIGKEKPKRQGTGIFCEIENIVVAISAANWRESKAALAALLQKHTG